MASLIYPKDRAPYILFQVGDDRRRVPLHNIPKLTKRTANEIKMRVEYLAVALVTNSAVEPTTAEWVSGIDDLLYGRLVKVGLVQPRLKSLIVTVEQLVKRFTSMKSRTLEPSSLKRMEIELDRFVGWVGVDTDIAKLTAGTVVDFQSWLAGQLASEAGQRTCCRYVKAAFAYAVEHEWLVRNPFAKIKSSAIAAKRAHYVSPEQAELVFAAIETHFKGEPAKAIQWKVLFGLARYAGLRTPSETCEITWRGVDWENNALIVPVRKTRRYDSERVVPIIPELLPLLEKAFELAPENAERVFSISDANIRRTLPKILATAGIPIWADLFQTLRRSSETRLIALGHPQHAVSQWLGH
jgi:integrase